MVGLRGKASSKQFLKAFAKAEATGEHQWLAMDTRQVSAELAAAQAAAFGSINEQKVYRVWLRKIVDRRTGVWIEVLESYRVSRGLPPY